MQSALYRGWVKHRRHAPTRHEFRYPLYMVYVDLDELPDAFDGLPGWSARGPALAWFRRQDHYGEPEQPLRECIDELVERTLGRLPRGPIRLLTHLRYFGYCFNPISCYYCYRDDGTLDAIIAEVNNTWGRRHCYVLDAADAQLHAGGWRRWHTDKVLHVSPFMPITQQYEWRFMEPGEQLCLHMSSRMDEGSRAPPSADALLAARQTHTRPAARADRARPGGGPDTVTGAGADLRPGRREPTMFDATLHLDREPLDAAAALRVLTRYPLMTLQVTGAIHFEAFKLWLKRTPVFPDPHAGDTVKETPEIRS